MLKAFFMCHYIPAGSNHVQVSIGKHFMSTYCEHFLCHVSTSMIPFLSKNSSVQKKQKKKPSLLKCSCAVLTCFITGEIIQQQTDWLYTRTEGRCGLRSLPLPADCFAILLYSGGFDLLLSWHPYRKRLT